MSEPPAPPPVAAAQIDMHALAKATRFALAMIVAVLAYFPFRFSFGISKFGTIFEDMLGSGAQLPVITTLVLGAAPLVTLVSGLIFLTPFATLLMRNIPRAIYILGITAIVAVVNWVVVFQALMLPMLEIVKRMQGAPPGM